MIAREKACDICHTSLVFILLHPDFGLMFGLSGGHCT